jgi:hypothetical protein
MSTSSEANQLQIYYPDENAWYTVELKVVIKVGVSPGSSMVGIMMALQEEDHGDILGDLIPGFSKLPPYKKEDYHGKSPEEGVKFIAEKGIERKLNTVVIASVDFKLATTGATLATYAVGVLTSVPEGKKPQVLMVSGVGDSLKKALANAIRVGSGSSGCFIATVCYSCANAPRLFHCEVTGMNNCSAPGPGDSLSGCTIASHPLLRASSSQSPP